MVDIAILAASNGKPIASWKYAPSLYLSVAYTIGNILLSAAFSQGLTVRLAHFPSEDLIQTGAGVNRHCRYSGGAML